MAKTRSSTPPAAKPRSDAYVGLLFIALLAQIAGAVFFYLDFDQYPKIKPASTVDTAPAQRPPAGGPAAGGGAAGAGGGAAGAAGAGGAAGAAGMPGMGGMGGMPGRGGMAGMAGMAGNAGVKK